MQNKFLQTSALILGGSLVGLETAQAKPENQQLWYHTMQAHCALDCTNYFGMKEDNDICEWGCSKAEHYCNNFEM